VISTFPRNPQRDYCYDFQPGSSHPRWTIFGEQVDRGSGLCAPTPAAIPIAPLRLTAEMPTDYPADEKCFPVDDSRLARRDGRQTESIFTLDAMSSPLAPAFHS
jgi:hypothetical protein